MSPMWLTSNTPTLERTALCSATRPPVAGYSTGISQPPKLTIFAPKRRCTAFSAVLRSSVMREVVTDSIPCAQAEMHTNMRLETRQRSEPRKQKAEVRGGTHKRKASAGNIIEETRHGRTSSLLASANVRYSFRGGFHGGSN